MKRSSIIRTLTLILAVGAATSAYAWDAVGHRAITWLAMDGMKADMPAFLRERANLHATGWEAAEPDRWRSVKSNFLVHENSMDHYIDIDDLDEFGMTIDTVNPLRYRFVRDMAVARAMHKGGDKPAGTGKFKGDDSRPPYNEKLDPSGQKEWPGFLPHAICEHHAKLIASFKTYRMLEKMNDPVRAPQLEMAKANIMVEMGVLSHFVGDAAQPLHTTRHHNGWVGDNPKGLTTSNKFHAYIDGGVISLHKLSYESLRADQKYVRKIADPLNPWPEVIAHIKRSNDAVLKTYELEKSGDLDKAPGKAFISERLTDGADMLAALYNAAWVASEPTEKDSQDFVRYDHFRAGELPAAARDPSVKSRPARSEPELKPAEKK